VALAHFLAKTQNQPHSFAVSAAIPPADEWTKYFVFCSVLCFAKYSLTSCAQQKHSSLCSKVNAQQCFAFLIIFRSYHSPPRIRDVVVVPLIEIQCYILIFHSLLSSRLEDVNFGHANLIAFVSYVCNVAD
jgi:hypothetical protein